ncbi:MAG: lipid II flippase MurJ, partial [Patescibacteria group bacterium]
MPLSFLNQKISTLHSAALILGAAGFLSRLLGLLRDRLLAGTFGASRELDIYYAAFQIPDVLYTILLLGAGSVAILPIFTEIFQRNPKHAEEFMNALITFFSFSAFIGICIAFLLAPSLSHA